MSNTILVAYATRYGSTREVAEKIADTLRASGFEIDIQPAKNVGSLGKYRAVVLGSPLYIGSWHNETKQFLSKHQADLNNLPTAVFALGPLHNEEKELQGAHEQLDKELAKFPWFKPAALQVFGGKYDPAKLHFPDKIIARLPASPLHQAPENDARDWEKIEGWAENLSRLFRQ